MLGYGALGARALGASKSTGTPAAGPWPMTVATANQGRFFWAEDTSTITQSSGEVISWADKFGNAALTEGTGNGPALYSSGGFGSKSVIRAANGDVLGAGSPGAYGRIAGSVSDLAGQTNILVVVAASFSTSSQAWGRIVSVGGGSGNDWDANGKFTITRYSTNAAVQGQSNSILLPGVGDTITSDTPFLATLRFDGTNMYWSFNGGAETSATCAFSFTSSGFLRLFADQDNLELCYGDIRSVQIYKGAATATSAMINAAVGWAAWDATGDGSLLPVGHAYKNAPPPGVSSDTAISAASFAVASPALTTGAVTQVHAAVAQSLAAGSPALATGAVTQKHVIVVTALSTGSPALVTGAVTQSHVVVPTALSTGSPALTTGSVTQSGAFNPNALATGPPALTTGAVTQNHVIVPQSLAASSPALAAGAVTQKHVVVAQSLATSSPALTTGAVTQKHVAAAQNLATSSPALTVGAVTQKHVVVAQNLAVGSPTLTAGSSAFSFPFSIGVNISGAEGGDRSGPVGTAGTNYFWPSTGALDYLQARGITIVRLPIQPERIQPTLGAALSSTYGSELVTTLNNLGARGIKAIVDLHGYNEFWDKSGGSPVKRVMGDGVYTTALFADMCSRLATLIKGNSGLYGYDIQNEPQSINDATWVSYAQAAITAIRGTGATEPIIVCGVAWASPVNYGTTNPTLHTLTDSLNKLVFSAHSYPDPDGSGTHYSWAECAAGGTTVNTLANRIADFGNWLTAHGLRGYIGETNVGNDDANWDTTLDNALSYCQGQGIPVSLWLYGEYYGATPYNMYLYSSVPTRQWGVVAKYLSAANPTTYLLSGPHLASAGAASSNFTVTYQAGYRSTSFTVTPSDGGQGGTFTPSAVTVPAGFSPSATFTYTPSTTPPGTISISVTNSAGLTNPSAISLSIDSGIDPPLWPLSVATATRGRFFSVGDAATVTQSGGEVTALADKFGNTALTESGGSGPILATSGGFGTRAVIRATNGDTLGSSAPGAYGRITGSVSDLAGQTNILIVVAASILSESQQWGRILSIGSGSGADWNANGKISIQRNNLNTSVQVTSNSLNLPSDPGDAVTSDVPFVVSVRFDGTNFYWSLNGGSEVSASCAFTFTTGGSLRLFADQDGVEQLYGDIRSVQIYKGTAVAPQAFRDAAIGWAAWDAMGSGSLLPVGHAYRSAPPAVSGSITVASLAVGSPTLTAGAVTQKHVVVAQGLATSSPTLTTGAVTQTHVVTATSLNTGSPTLTTGAVTQKHVVVATSLSTGSPALTTGAATQNQIVSPNALALGSPALVAGAVTQGQVAVAQSLSVGSPALTTGTVTQFAQGSMVPLAVGSPVLSAGSVTQTHVIQPVGLATGSPTLTVGAISQVHVASVAAKAVSSPSLVAGAVTQAHAIQPVGLATGSPALVSGSVTQAHAVQPSPLTLGSPALAVGAVAQGHVAQVQGLAVGSPVLQVGVVAQQHVAHATNLTLGSPALQTGAVTQAHAAIVQGLAVGSPSLQAGAVTQRHVVQATGLAIGSPALVSGSVTQAHAIQPVGLAAGSPTLQAGAVSQQHVAVAQNLSAGSPAIVAGAVTQRHVAVVQGLSVGSPFVHAGSVFQGADFPGPDFSVGSPTLQAGAVTQRHVVQAQGLSLGQPVLQSGVVSQVHKILGQALSVGSPTLDPGFAFQGQLAQANLLSVGSPTLQAGGVSQSYAVGVASLAVGSPVLVAGSLSQIYAVQAANLSTGSLGLSLAVVGQAHATQTQDLVLGSPVLVSGTYISGVIRPLNLIQLSGSRHIVHLDGMRRRVVL
jgi:endoglucanase